MNRDALQKLLQEVAAGALSAELASERLQYLACQKLTSRPQVRQGGRGLGRVSVSRIPSS